MNVLEYTCATGSLNHASVVGEHEKLKRFFVFRFTYLDDRFGLFPEQRPKLLKTDSPIQYIMIDIREVPHQRHLGPHKLQQSLVPDIACVL